MIIIWLLYHHFHHHHHHHHRHHHHYHYYYYYLIIIQAIIILVWRICICQHNQSSNYHMIHSSAVQLSFLNPRIFRTFPFSILTHYRNAPIEKRRPWKLGYPLGFASSNKVSKTTAIFRCRQNSERRICNFSVSHLWADNTDTIEGLTIVLKCRNAGFIGKGFRAWST